MAITKLYGSILADAEFDGDYLKISDGTTAERPGSPIAGMIRFNTTTELYEGYDGTEWVNISGFASLQEDLSPVLGGNLDVNGNSITSVSNGNITFQPHGTGVIDFKNDNTQESEIRLYCESNNAHYVALKSNVHANYSGDVTLTLPTQSGVVATTGKAIAMAIVFG